MQQKISLLQSYRLLVERDQQNFLLADTTNNMPFRLNTVQYQDSRDQQRCVANSAVLMRILNINEFL